jgi:hypothetical protein
MVSTSSDVNAIALSEPAWGFLGVLAVQTVILVSLYWQTHRGRKEISSINRAVNHQPSSAPTLVQRVGEIEHDSGVHRRWVHDALHAIAVHVGCLLPPLPEEHDGTQEREVYQ